MHHAWYIRLHGKSDEAFGLNVEVNINLKSGDKLDDTLNQETVNRMMIVLVVLSGADPCPTLGIGDDSQFLLFLGVFKPSDGIFDLKFAKN